MRQAVGEELVGDAKLRRTRLLEALSIATSSWYRQPVAAEQRRRPGPAPQPIAEAVRQAVVTMAVANPWYGYKRIAVMCRRAGQAVQDRQVYVVRRGCCRSRGRVSRSCTRRRSCSSCCRKSPMICGKWM